MLPHMFSCLVAPLCFHRFSLNPHLLTGTLWKHVFVPCPEASVTMMSRCRDCREDKREPQLGRGGGWRGWPCWLVLRPRWPSRADVGSRCLHWAPVLPRTEPASEQDQVASGLLCLTLLERCHDLILEAISSHSALRCASEKDVNLSLLSYPRLPSSCSGVPLA